MKTADTFVSSFMEKLENGELKREIEPQIGEGVDLTKEVIDQHIESFSKLLESDVAKAVLDDDAPVLKKNLGTIHK